MEQASGSPPQLALEEQQRQHDKSVQQLQNTFERYSSQVNSRMEKLETNVAKILEILSSKAAPQQPSSFGQIEHQSDLLTPTKTLELRVLNLEQNSKWFTKRTFPDFEVQIVDPATGHIYKDTGNMHVSVRCVSGHGLYVDHLMIPAPPQQTFPAQAGRVYVSGVKFMAVSSRNGGFFQLEFTATNVPPGCYIAPVRSSEITILSERLKNENKASSILELSPDDSLVRVPGIGKKYAAKLAEQNINTVRDLASIDNSPQTRDHRLTLLNEVRKDRGALTEAKLAELLREAKTVVKRSEADSPMDDGPTAKRQKTKTVDDDVFPLAMGKMPAFDAKTLDPVNSEWTTSLEVDAMLNTNILVDYPEYADF